MIRINFELIGKATKITEVSMGVKPQRCGAVRQQK